MIKVIEEQSKIYNKQFEMNAETMKTFINFFAIMKVTQLKFISRMTYN